MYKFLIEREIPGAGQLTNDQLVAVAQKSCGVLRDLGPQIQWVHSYVTADKITCIYLAPDAELIREHARRSGFPADRIEQVDAIIDPVTAQGALWGSGSAASGA